MRQAYDYWQDQPGSYELFSSTHGGRWPSTRDFRSDRRAPEKTSTNTPRCARAHVATSVFCASNPRAHAEAHTLGPDARGARVLACRPRSTHTRLPEDFPNGEPSSSGTLTGRKRIEGDAYQTRRRPSLYGCRLDRTVRASIRVIRVRRAVSGPTHHCTAGAGVRQKRPRSRAVACLPFPLERAVYTALPPTGVWVSLGGDARPP